MDERFSERPLPRLPVEAPSSDSPEESDEGGLSHREKNALRTVRAAVFTLLFWPLLPYVYWLLFRVWRSRGRLSGRPRRQVLITTWLALLLPLTIAGLLVAALIPRAPAEVDLRKYPHPPELVGKWVEERLVLELRRDGKMHYEEAGVAARNWKGFWGYANHSLYLQVKESNHPEDLKEQFRGWGMVSCTDTELLLESGKMRLQRQP